MTGFIEPAKVVFHLLSLRSQRIVALPFALTIYAIIHGIYRVAAKLAPSRASLLPLFPHMMLWSQQPFSLVWMQCFDLIHAPVSHHFHRHEMEALARTEGLEVRTLVNTNQTLWSLVAVKPATASSNGV